MFSKKQKSTDIESVLSNVLNLPDLNVFTVRGRKCDVIFANITARASLGSDLDMNRGCEMSFAKNYQNLCNNCPFGKKGGNRSAYFELKDKSGRTYIASCNETDWFDGEPAVVFFTRDITKEKEVSDKLYSLAYLDQLTGIPNRRKLQDDFAALEEIIANNMLCGVVALFDLDNFKTVNDTYGHNTGDLILRRLTEHLQANSAFNGHLYRLGGDEFVLLFSESPEKFGSEKKMLAHYKELISTALCSYTLPNIDVSCTLSIGISIFPRHGLNLSEILRKADIAMYKAKTNGRNQVCIFEDKYDSAQKFKDLFINLQPVLFASRETFGYDLVDRGNDGEGEDSIVSLSGVNRTIDALGLDDIKNDLRFFIAYSSQLMNPFVSKTMPRNKFIIQVNLPDTITKNEIETYLALRKNGFKLALVGLHGSNAVKEVLAFADYGKFNTEKTNMDEQKKIIEENPKIRFIATDIDSQDAYLRAKNAGFGLYQGFFFSQNQPEMTRKTKDMSPMKVNYLHLLKHSSTDGYMDFNEISTIISCDVALTYKLLRILNSAAVGLRNVSSVSMAVAYLGEENLKQWIAVLALRGIAEDQPMELVRMSLIRARFGELLAPHFYVKQEPKKIFMVGLLSLLHVAFEMPKAELLEEMPVSQEIRDSLLTNEGVYSALLRFYENYEYANWDDVSTFIETNKLNSQVVNDSYIAATKWYNDLIES
ncbi:MAG: diguanylate cyclase [Oscillospiraceae bacterium]|jgi:EAL and modified HD-GYP domain-containing signal transduction protein|nr:diguanylate cyclase [Oscillospiraceae bacterium]